MSLLIWQYLHCAQTLPTHQPLNYRVVCYCMLWHYMKKLVVRRKNCPVNHLLRSNLFQHGHHPSCPSNPETQKLLSDAPGNQHLMSTNSYWAHFLALCGRGCVAPRRLHRAWQERGEGHPKSGLDWSDGMSTLQKLSNLTVEWSWTPWQEGGGTLWQGPARVGFWSSRSEKWKQKAFTLFWEVQSEKKNVFTLFWEVQSENKMLHSLSRSAKWNQNASIKKWKF